MNRPFVVPPVVPRDPPEKSLSPGYAVPAPFSKGALKMPSLLKEGGICGANDGRIFQSPHVFFAPSPPGRQGWRPLQILTYKSQRTSSLCGSMWVRAPYIAPTFAHAPARKKRPAVQNAPRVFLFIYSQTDALHLPHLSPHIATVFPSTMTLMTSHAFEQPEHSKLLGVNSRSIKSKPLKLVAPDISV